MIFFLIPWFVRVVRNISFWLYLWQLKDYHIGRFIDHFRTEQGKKLLWNRSIAVKLFFVISFVLVFFGTQVLYVPGLFTYVFISFWIIAFFVLYIVEGGIAFKRMLKKQLLLPVPTSKIVLLRLVLTIFTLLLLFYVQFALDLSLPLIWINPYLLLLGYDLLTPLIVSLVVLLFQPFAVFGRNRIIASARKKREQFKNLTVIGITGSFGKTSTKEFLSFILSQKFKVLKTKEHQNSEVGVSQCILNELNDSHEIFVCEMGAYGKGGIKLLANIAKPKIGIMIGANEQHLATFGSMENLLSAEGGKELVDSLPGEGVAIFNGNNKYAEKLYQESKGMKKILCGRDVKAENILIEQRGISFAIDNVGMKANLLGGYNIDNLLLAITCARELGMNLEEIAMACSRIPQELGAMKLNTTKDGLNIIDSTYSANPDGVFSALEYLKVWSQKKILVMPCLIELGSASSEIHKKIGERIMEVCDLAIITTKDRFDDIKEGAKNSEKVICLEHEEQIVKKIQSIAGPGDVVLLEGRVSSNIKQLLTI